MADSLLDTLALIAVLVAVTELDSLELAGGGAGRDDGTAEGAVLEGDFDLDGRVGAGVEDLAAVDAGNLAHGRPSFLLHPVKL